MRTRTTAWLALVVAAAGFVRLAGGSVADDVKLEGTWKMVILAFGEDDFVIFNAKADGRTLTGEVTSAQPFLGDAKIEKIEAKGDAVTINFRHGEDTNIFRGKLAKDGDDACRVLGTFRFREQFYPARLETTDAEKVGPTGRGTVAVAVQGVNRERDAKVRINKLDEIIEEHAGKPSLNVAYAAVLRSADQAELGEDQVKAYIAKWIDSAKPYGAEWVNQSRVSALIALNGKKDYVDLALELAAAVDKALSEDISAEDESNLVKLYAAAAKLAGKSALAASLEARAEKLETKLDTEYLVKVPPFKPEPFAKRRSADDDRVVLMELFTGAQCPPCVAADVGFDGLLKTYRPTEFIALQYHMHIPGPDPMTTEGSQTRGKYYGLRGTPATYFNGKEGAGGGGGMANSKEKYDQFRGVIEENLYGKKATTIDLKVNRKGDTLQIAAAAKATSPPKQADSKKSSGEVKKDDDDKDAKKDDKKDEPQLKLRLVLTEESVHYVGGNRLRFHHHVVRAFPGGVEGKPLANGACSVNLSLDLAEVRSEITEFIAKFAKTGAFANTPPSLDFKHLALVAFVQDDNDKSVLHVTTVPVAEVN